MKQTEINVVNEIFKLKAEGLSSRKIGSRLGLGKSTVNDILNRYSQPKNTYPKIALIDTETSAALAYTFGRFNVNLTQNHIKEEGGKILVACYKWLGEEQVHRLYMTPEELFLGNDFHIVSELYEVYEKADAVVMHNAKKFDHKVIQTRGLANDLGMLPIVKIIDTLEIAKKNLRLPSNALDSIGSYFGLGRKIDTGGIELWKRVQEGDVQAMQHMVEYCHGDIALLEAVFLKLAPLGIPGFNASLYTDNELHLCKVCSSDKVLQTGRTVKLVAGEYAEYECCNCGHKQRGKELLNTRQKRKTLLA